MICCFIFRILHRASANASGKRRSLRLQRARERDELINEEGRAVEVMKEKSEVREDQDSESLMSFCEVKIEYDDVNEASYPNESDDLIYFNDENDENEENCENDLHGDYSCQRCNILFKTRNMLKSHTKSVHEAIQCYKCKICQKTYNDPAVFDAHITGEHEIDIAHGHNFLDRLTLYRVSSNKPESPPDSKIIVTTFETKADVLSCSNCDYKSKNKRSLAIHVAKHFENAIFSCKTCGRKFENRRDLIYHIRFIHRGEHCICDYCGKSYRNPKGLDEHRKFVHFRGKHECKICHRGLASEKNLDEHMVNMHVKKKTHKKRKTSVCEACGKIFSDREKLTIHMRVHTGERPYPCIICKESFAKKNSLKQHLILHTGAKPYVCDICGKQFAQKPGLSYHRKSHPGPIPPLPPVFIDPLIENLLRQCEQ